MISEAAEARLRAMAADPSNQAERAHDEQQLTMLNCWDDGWTVLEIGAAFGVTRMVPIGVVHRTHNADPEALARKPDKLRRRA